jgi:hypothetical protein
MNSGPVIFGLLALGLGTCAIAAPAAWIRAGALCLTLGLAAALWQTSLGRPRPPLLEDPSGTVIGYQLDEPRAIYLWVVGPGEHAPTSFALPWSEQQASQLQQASEQAKKQGDSLQAGGKGQHGRLGAFAAAARTDLRFYPAEHHALPPKAIARN